MITRPLDDQGYLLGEFRLVLGGSSSGDVQLHQRAAILSRWQQNSRVYRKLEMPRAPQVLKSKVCFVDGSLNSTSVLV